MAWPFVSQNLSLWWRNANALKSLPKQILSTFMAFTVIIGITSGASSLTRSPPVYIRDLKVPRTVINGSEPYVILDCDYRLDKNDTTLLVVNWYLNHSELVYQWIYGNGPQALGRLHSRVNLEYEASEIPFEMFRALQILNPTTELSGEYSCKVSITAGEAYKTAKMTIYSPATDVDLKISSGSSENGIESDSLNITCWALGVYPKPIMTLYYGNNETHRLPLDDVEYDVSNNEDDAFDTFMFKTLSKDNVSSSTLFTCDLKIADANYYMRKEVYWQKEGSAALKLGPGMCTMITLMWFALIIGQIGLRRIT